MDLFLDTEFTDFQGRLLSVGIIAQDGSEFYKVLDNITGCSAWVRKNVVPVLGKEPEPLEDIQFALENWLLQYDTITIIADWPEDIAHFCNLLITEPGMRIDTPPLTMVVDRRLSSAKSQIPHNALADARAIKQSYFQKEQKCQ